MSNSIHISEKHGVNPTIPICYWCEKEKNEIALLGKLPGDKEAPKHAVINYEPCEECNKKFKRGVQLIEVEFNDNNNKLPIGKGAYPTGRFIVVAPSMLNGKFKEGEKALMTVNDFKHIIALFESIGVVI